MSERWPRQLIVGLTGNIATGKSAVLRMAAERGALALDADKIVHEILDNDPSMGAAIVAAFGEHLRRGDGSIDRAALGAIVFEDEDALRDLELLVHPAVRLEIARRIEASNSRIVMVEAIKLLEGDLADMCDQIWVTRCPRTLQEQRLIICRGLDRESAAMRIEAQNPQEAKVARADVVIDTHGSMAQTRVQVEQAWRRLLQALPDTEAKTPRHISKPVAQPPPRENAPQERPSSAASKDTSEGASETGGAQVYVRRARPLDIPALLLLVRRATGGRAKQSRAEMLMSFSERSYLIGQIGAEVVSAVGWNTDSTTAVCIDQIYAHPVQTIATVGPTMLQEIERSARELICEVVLVFLPQDAPGEFRQLLRSAGYEQMAPSEMRRAWQQTVKERQPQSSVIMGKIMRDVRVA